MQRLFDRLNLISSVGFALAAGGATSLAVATSWFGANDQETMGRLMMAADALGAATSCYGAGFISAFMAALIPIARLEQCLSKSPKMTRIFTFTCFIIYLSPLLSVALATTFLITGIFLAFLSKPGATPGIALIFGWVAILYSFVLLSVVWFS
jgi:hypothetical protein